MSASSALRPPRRPRVDLGSDDDGSPPPALSRPSARPSPAPPSAAAAGSASNASNSGAPAAAAANTDTHDDDDDDDDDYLNMTIEEPTRAETLSERQKRKARESEIRGRPLSKAELARAEKEKRDAALATSLLAAEDARRNKGLRMMKKMGFTPGAGLGRAGAGAGASAAVLEPIAVETKDDRAGIGHDSAQKRKFRDAWGGEDAEAAAAADGGQEKKQKAAAAAADPEAFRERVRAEREERRREGLFYSAQKVCEAFDTERDTGVAAEARRTRPLRAISVLWRGLVKHREEAERERRLRFDLLGGVGDRPRLPGIDRLSELDAEDKVALGLDAPRLRALEETVVEAEGAEEEDPELEEFEALSFAERLDRIVEYLRGEYCYCFWCKFRYEDATALEEGCPGPDEDSHG